MLTPMKSKSLNLELPRLRSHRPQHQDQHFICPQLLFRRAKFLRITSPTLFSPRLQIRTMATTLCIMHILATEVLCLVVTRNPIILHRHPLTLQEMFRHTHFNSKLISADMVPILPTVATLTIYQIASLIWVRRLLRDTIRDTRTS